MQTLMLVTTSCLHLQCRHNKYYSGHHKAREKDNEQRSCGTKDLEKELYTTGFRNSSSKMKMLTRQSWREWSVFCYAGTAVGINFRFEVQSVHNEYYANKYKIKSKGADTGYVTCCKNVATPRSRWNG